MATNADKNSRTRGRSLYSAVLDEVAEDMYGTRKRLQVLVGWLEMCRLDSGQSLQILDFGCGTGADVTIPLGRLGYRVLGVDIDDASIQAGKKLKAPTNIELECLTVDELLTRRRKFDVVICTEVLEHLPRPDATLRKLTELTLPNGHVILTVPNGEGCFETLRRIELALDPTGLNLLLGVVTQHLRGLKAFLRERKLGRSLFGKPVREIPGYLDMECGHIQFFTYYRFNKMVAEAGLLVESVRGRTAVCGPYVDWWLWNLPFRDRLYALNNFFGDRLPLRIVAGWMFLVKRADW